MSDEEMDMLAFEQAMKKLTAYDIQDKYPEQAEEFLKITQEMYRVFSSKMNDYSPWNMLGTGELGAIVRLWDKTARLMNLYGFDIGTGKLNKPTSPKYESIEDNLTDLANYAIITLILLRGKWGK